MKLPSYLIACCLLTMSFMNLLAHADNSPDGKKLVETHCANCHGKYGNVASPNAIENNKDGDIPKIAGFSAILLFDILDQFKYSERKVKQIEVINKEGKRISTDMSKVLQKISAEEMQTIALYLSKQTFIPNNPSTNKSISTKKSVEKSKLIAQGKQVHEDLCNDCHVDLATSSADDAPILAGQFKAYLVRQFKNISSRERYAPRKMRRKYRKLTDADKTALVEYYTQTY